MAEPPPPVDPEAREPATPDPDGTPDSTPGDTAADTDDRNHRRRRLDARTSADIARHDNLSARDAFDSSATSAPAVRAAAQARLTASVVGLRAAVDALAVLDAQDGPDSTDEIDIDVHAQPDGRTVIVRPYGELDLLTCPHLEQVMVAQIDDGSLGRLVVDLSQVSFLDSSALAVLVEVHHVANENGTHVAITGLNERKRRLFEITRLDKVLDII